MRLNIAKVDDNRRIVLGTVKSVKVGKDGEVVNVQLEGTVWDKDDQVEKTETIDIAFWNNDEIKNADRVVAAKVSEGSVISVLIHEKDGKVSGNNFKYKGHWVIPARGEQKERNIFHGVVASMTPDKEGRYVRVSMPVDGKNDEEPTWHSMTFWNNEKSNVADRAKKCLGKRTVKNSEGEDVEKSARALIICGENRPYNGTAQYSAYDFVLLS